MSEVLPDLRCNTLDLAPLTADKKYDDCLDVGVRAMRGVTARCTDFG